MPSREVAMSGGMDQPYLSHVSRIFGISIHGFLAGDTARRPRYRREPFRTDFILAAQAEPKHLCLDAAKCGSNIAKQSRIAFKIADLDISLGGVLGPVQFVGAGSIARPSRFPTICSNSVFRISRMPRNFFSSLFVMVVKDTLQAAATLLVLPARVARA
jgi:hypothetical protein